MQAGHNKLKRLIYDHLIGTIAQMRDAQMLFDHPSKSKPHKHRLSINKRHNLSCLETSNTLKHSAGEFPESTQYPNVGYKRIKSG